MSDLDLLEPASSSLQSADGRIPEGAPAQQAGQSRRERLLWRLNRLRAMSPAEILRRIRNLLFQWGERAVLLRLDPPAPSLAAKPAIWVGASAAHNVAAYVDAADRILAGKLSIFALSDAQVGSPPRWNQDPLTGIEAPMSYGRAIDYRRPELVGDIKYVWELNRHLHLVPLAQAYAVSGDQRYLRGLAEQLGSWLEQCPRGYGPNWNSSLELAIRLINWSLVWQLVGGWESPLFDGSRGQLLRQRWVESIYCHAHGIRHHLSLYSSANNHLIGEAAGLYVATLTWPLWPVCRRWRRLAKKLLERECALQTHADGVNKEQASAYQQFVLEFFIVAALAAKAAGEPFGADFCQRIKAMLDFLATITDYGGNRPMLGDGDDGVVTGLLSSSGNDQGGWLLAVGACLFQRGDWLHKAGGLDEKARWLLGLDAIRECPEPKAEAVPLRRSFPEGGYYLLGTEFGTEREIRVLADAGPLGYLSIAAHGHADALAFTLSVGGREFLVDPGTYVYHRDRRWRDYFRSTAAHNTVRIDGVDQSVASGSFMWRSQAQARCEHWDCGPGRDVWLASHDGYLRLRDPVLHRRRLELIKSERRLLIEDTLECRGEHIAEWFWHFSEHCQIRQVHNEIIAEQGGTVLRLRLPAGEETQVQLLRGSQHPLGGWVSRRFDVKQPSSTVLIRRRLRGSEAVVTEILC